jgi:hypothetical protein
MDDKRKRDLEERQLDEFWAEWGPYAKFDFSKFDAETVKAWRELVEKIRKDLQKE